MISASKLLILFGVTLLIFGAYLVFQRYTPRSLEFQNFYLAGNSSTNVTPAIIIIPSLDIKLKVKPAKITNGRWEATNNGVSYLSATPLPGTQGNSVFYGHNFRNLLGPLPKIKPGDKIKIILSNGEEKNFVVKFTSVVAPSDTNILSDSADSRITLYTCAGFLDSKRFVATALLKN